MRCLSPSLPYLAYLPCLPCQTQSNPAVRVDERFSHLVALLLLLAFRYMTGNMKMQMEQARMAVSYDFHYVISTFSVRKCEETLSFCYVNTGPVDRHIFDPVHRAPEVESEAPRQAYRGYALLGLASGPASQRSTPPGVERRAPGQLHPGSGHHQAASGAGRDAAVARSKSVEARPASPRAQGARFTQTLHRPHLGLIHACAFKFAASLQPRATY